MLVPMELSRILIRENQAEQLIELRETDASEDAARTLPIVIGIVEAAAIGRRLDGYELPRPMTHDLLSSVIDELGATLDAIEIVDLVDGAFIARLSMTNTKGERVLVDARPSDALAIGVAKRVPIFTEDHVLAQAAAPTQRREDHDH